MKPLYLHMLAHSKEAPTVLVTWSITDPFSHQFINIYLTILKVFTSQNG